jgi:formiminotetrahydrofolate cyclodeaminase
MVANRLSSGNDDEKPERASAIRQANEYAIEIPLEVAMLCSRVIDLTKVLVEKGNPNSISDVGVAADVALAGVRGASMNVLINLPNIQDEVYCNNKRKAVEKLIQDAETKRNIVFDKTMKIINS